MPTASREFCGRVDYDVRELVGARRLPQFFFDHVVRDYGNARRARARDYGNEAARGRLARGDRGHTAAASHHKVDPVFKRLIVEDTVFAQAFQFTTTKTSCKQFNFFQDVWEGTAFPVDRG